MTEAVAVPVELEAKSTSLTVQARQFPAIRDADQYRDAVNLGRSLKAMINGITDFWTPLISSAYAQHKALVARRNSMTSPVEGALNVIDDLTKAFDREQERVRQEAERACAAELKRMADEVAMQTASSLQEAGDAAGAQQVIEQAITAPPPPVIMPKMVPKVAGKTTRDNWKFRIVNESLIPREYMEPAESKIGQVVRALKEKANIPGIQVYNDPVNSWKG